MFVCTFNSGNIQFSAKSSAFKYMENIIENKYFFM